MTRINVIDPVLLLNEHVLSEWRELPRIPNELIRYPGRLKPGEIPAEYRLSTGHVKFFRNKLLYLADRHAVLCKEMDRRGIKRNPSVKVSISDFNGVMRLAGMNTYIPTKEAILINLERIQERFDLRKKAYHFTDSAGKKHIVNDEQSFNEYLKILEDYYNL